jgi:phage regulator Rha-like protein
MEGSMRGNDLVPAERVERAILVMRGRKVIIDGTLAALYGVTTKRLNEQVKRNVERFPDDFVFQLTEEEHVSLRSHSATLDTGRGRHRKYRPFAFTEHGALMAASVLSSPKAIEMSILVVRAFVRLRELLATHSRLAAKLGEHERGLARHDRQFVVLFDAIRELMAPPVKQKKRIGFGEE